MLDYNTDVLHWDLIKPDVNNLLERIQIFTWCVISRLQLDSYTKRELLHILDIEKSVFSDVADAVIDALLLIDILEFDGERYAISNHLRVDLNGRQNKYY